MKYLKVALSIVLGMLCLIASSFFVCNQNITSKKNVVICCGVEQLCDDLNNETVFVESNSTKSQILNKLNVDNMVANVCAVGTEETLSNAEIVEFCSENKMVALEVENGFEVYRKFQLKQLIVNGFIEEYYGAEKVAVCFGDIHILQYATEEETELAYNKFKESNVKVSIGQIVKTRASASSNYNSWGAEESNIDEFQSYLNTNGSTEDVVVVVLDTGINTAHEMFAGRLLEDMYGNIVGTSYYDSKYKYSGYSFEDDNVESGTPKGHGTHVAGIVADLTPQNVKILPIKVMDNKGSGSSTHIIAGLEKIYEDYSEDYKIVCANMSLGGSCDTILEANELNELFDEIFIKLRNKGIVPVVAAGNEASNTKYTWPSGCHDTAIVVSALKNTYSGTTFDSSYSNYGESVDIAAPGTAIYSATIGKFAYWEDSDAYLTMSGTSMAAPHVAAMVALINLDLNFMRASTTCSEIEERLLSMTEDLGSVGFDIYYGQGGLCYKAEEIEIDPGFETEEYIVENTSVYYDGYYHNIKVTVKNIDNYTIYYGFTENSCTIQNIETNNNFLYNTHGEKRIYFRIVAPGVEDIVDFGILNIKPHPIKIRIEDRNIVYGDAFQLDEPGAYTLISGSVVNNDDLNIDLDCLAEMYSNVGKYTIMAVCGNDNYNLTYERGELTIAPRKIKIRLKNQKNYTAASFEIKQDAYEIISGNVVNNDDLFLNIYLTGNKLSFDKQFELTAISNNANYQVYVETAKLYIKCSYMEIVTIIACSVAVVFIIIKIVKKKKNK